MGDTGENIAIKKSGLSMTLNARKGKNQITLFYLKAKIYSPEGQSPQEANINLLEESKVRYDKEKRVNWRNKLGLPK